MQEAISGRPAPHPSALVERADELQRLDAAIDAAVAGNGGIALIHGPAGVGKTRLLSEACRRARGRDVAVLAARGTPLEAEFGFGVVRQLLEARVRGLRHRSRAALFKGAASLAAAVLGVVLADGAEVAPSADLDTTIHALYWVVVNLAGCAPLVLAVDDVQWADAESQRWLAYLGARVRELPVLLVLTLRAGDPGTDPRALAAIAGESGAPITPQPLTAAGSAAVARERLGTGASAELSAALHEATRGNPLLLSLLLDDLSEIPGPPPAALVPDITTVAAPVVAPYVLTRIARLGHDAGAVAEATAILGAGTPLVHAARFADLPLEAAATAAARLVAEGILEPGEDLAFVHPLLHEAINHDLGTHRAAAGHARAAAILHDAGVDPERVASHLLRARPAGEPDAIAALRDAAAGAAARGAAGAAVTYLRRALEESARFAARGEVLLELGRLEFSLGDPAAEEHLAAALREPLAPDRRALAALLILQPLTHRGCVREAVELGAAVADEIAQELPDVALTLRAAVALGGRADARAADLGRAVSAVLPDAPAQPATPGERALCVLRAIEALVDNAPAERGATLASAALGDGALVREATSDSALPHTALVVPWWGDDLATARRETTHLLEDARERGSLFGTRAARRFNGLVAIQAGDLEAAEAEFLFDIEHSPGGPGFRELVSLRGLLQIHTERGDFSAGEKVIAARPVPPRLESAWPAVHYAHAVARFRIAEHRQREALAVLEGVGEHARAAFPSPAFGPWRSDLALVLHTLQLGPARVQALLAEELELALAARRPRAIGIAQRARGLIAGEVALLEEAATVLRESPSRLELARALVDCGAAMRRVNRRADARAPLREGLELAQRCGATLLAQRAETELRATGARPRRPMRTGIDALTPSQRRVADLAATGMTNRDIAAALFITTKTVEAHMSAIFRTLDVGSRRELATALAR